MKHIVSFSTGLVSAFTALRVVEKYGKQSTQLVFMDTQFEDEDNYRFMQDFIARFELVLVVLVEGRKPYEVAAQQHIIPNDKLAPCTRKLKIEPFRNYLKLFDEPLTVHIGYDYTEMERCDKTRAAYEALGFSVDFPMLWKPYELRSYAQVCRDEWAILPPRMYGMAYTHANCGGRCVRQGKGDWLRTLLYFPERFAEIEQWEQEMRQNPKNANYALLQTKDSINKRRIPMTLRELRLQYEAKQIGVQDLYAFDYQSPCVVCGVGDTGE